MSGLEPVRSDRILIVGASGFLGSNIALAARGEYSVTAHSSRVAVRAAGIDGTVADLRPPGSANRLVRDVKPNVVINCAALADVDACEDNPELARRLNADVPGEIAEACRIERAACVHISTDAVFGDGSPPFTPMSMPVPVNVYGATKLEGERRVLNALSGALVVRTNIVGWSPSGRRSLLEFFHARLSEGQVARGFGDVLFRPVAVCDLWPLVERLIASGIHGIWHATGADLISKFAFGVSVARTFGFDEKLVVLGALAERGLAAPRPRDLDVVPSLELGRDAPKPVAISDGLVRLRDQSAQGYRQMLASLLPASVN